MAKIYPFVPNPHIIPVTTPPETVAVAVAVSPTNVCALLPAPSISNAVPLCAFESEDAI